jgi:chemotaxis signal transduction protein
VGLVVDAVQDLCEIPKGRISPLRHEDARLAEISLGLGRLADRSVTILDAGRLLAPPEEVG